MKKQLKNARSESPSTSRTVGKTLFRPDPDGAFRNLSSGAAARLTAQEFEAIFRQVAALVREGDIPEKRRKELAALMIRSARQMRVWGSLLGLQLRARTASESQPRRRRQGVDKRKSARGTVHGPRR